MTTIWPPDVILERNGIRLEPLSLAHETGLRNAACDGELWNLRVTSVPEPDKVRAYIEQALAMRAAGNRLAFAVIDSVSNTVIGSTSYHDIVAPVQRVEIGYTWYAKSRQRSAVNTTCKLLLMQHAFETLNCPVVGWRTDIFNFASQRAIERLGAKRDGVIRHHAQRRDGTVRDTVMYSLLREDWPACQQKLEQRLTQGGYERKAATANVQLTEISADNINSVLKLEPGAVGRRMVATNGDSIAQAAYSPNAWQRVIMVNDTAVGYVLLFDPTLDAVAAAKKEEPANVLYVWRLMLDFQQQGKGYGTAVLQQIIAYARTRPGITEVRLSYVPSAGNAEGFYQRSGFTKTGRIEDGEVEMTLPL